MAGQTMASCREGLLYGPTTVATGGRTFTWRTRRASSSLPGIIDISNCSTRDHDGHFAYPRSTTARPPSRARARGLVDEAGIPILYTSGANFQHRAWARISFPDGRWLRSLSGEQEKPMP
jgi:hypothetical protein